MTPTQDVGELQQRALGALEDLNAAADSQERPLTEEQRIKLYLKDPNNPDHLKRRLVEAYQRKLSERAHTTSTPTTTTEHPLAEGVGGFVGGVALPAAGAALLGVPAGPAGIAATTALSLLGAGAGAVGARAAAEQRIPTLLETAKTFLPAVASEGVGRGAGALITRGAGALAGPFLRRTGAAATREAGEHFGIPLSASDITQSRPVRMLENFPSYFAIGSGRIQRFREGQLRAAGEATETLVDRLSQDAADAYTAGLASKGGARRVFRQWKADKARLYDDVAAITGPTPVVPTTQFQDAVQQFGYVNGVPGLTPRGQAAFQNAMQAPTITMDDALVLQQELGGRAWRHSGPMGTIPQGQLKQLWAGMDRGIDEFLQSGPTGQAADQALDAAKQTYVVGKDLYQNSARRIVFGTRHRPLSPEDVVKRAFHPAGPRGARDAISDILDYKQLVDDETYQQATKVWLDGLRREATVNGQFVPSRFIRALRPYDQQLEIILDPQTAGELRNLLAVFERLSTAERLALNTSGTGQAILGAGQLRGLVQGGTGRLAADVGLPAAVSRFVTSPTGIDTLVNASADPLLGLARMLGPTTARAVAHSLQPDLQP